MTRSTARMLISSLFCAIFQIANGQETFNYQLQLAENIEVDSIVVVINNFHDPDALYWSPPFEYERIKLAANKHKEYSGTGSLEHAVASGQLLLFRKEQRTALELVVKCGSNKAYLEDIDYTNARLTQQKYLKFDGITYEQNRFMHDFTRLIAEFYEKFGVADADNPNIRTLPKSAANALKIAQVNVLKQYPDAASSVLKLFEIFNGNVNDTDYVLYTDAYNSLSAEVRNTPLGIQLDERLASKLKTFEHLKLGAQIPEFIGYTEDDSVFTNTRIHKPYILAFGATWCVPCKENLPRLRYLQEKLGIEVVYVNLDDDKARWKALIRENSLDWINVTDDKKINHSKIAADFNIFYLPKYFVVNATGKIIYSPDALEENTDDIESLESMIADALEHHPL